MIVTISLRVSDSTATWLESAKIQSTLSCERASASVSWGVNLRAVFTVETRGRFRVDKAGVRNTMEVGVRGVTRELNGVFIADDGIVLDIRGVVRFRAIPKLGLLLVLLLLAAGVEPKLILLPFLAVAGSDLGLFNFATGSFSTNETFLDAG